MAEKRVELPRFERVAQFRANSYDAESNTVEIIWTTGASVRRFDYWDGVEYDEVLSLEPGAIRLDRLNSGAPFLDSHNSYACDNVVGSIVLASAEVKDGLGTARVLLSKAAGVADTVQKIREGVLRNTSVGYWIHKVEKTTGEDGKIDRWLITDWEPLEVSVVPIPADPGSSIRSSTVKPKKGQPAPERRSCIIITSKPPAAGPKTPATQEKARMATRTAPKKPTAAAKRLAELETENKRLAALIAKRDTQKDDDDADERDAEQEDDKREGEDADDKRDAEDEDGEERSAEDDAADGEDGEERAAEDDTDDEKDERAAKTGKRKSLTAAEVRKEAQDAVRRDRERGAEIRKLGAQFGYPNLAERHANSETSIRAFKDLILEKEAARRSKSPKTFASAPAKDIDEAPAGRSAARTSEARAAEKGAAEARALLALINPSKAA